MKLHYQNLFFFFVFLNSLGCCPTEIQLSKDEKKLLQASKFNDCTTVENLLKQNSYINTRSKDKKRTPLMLAAFHGYQKLLNTLLSYRDGNNQGPDIDLQDNDGNTALMLSFFHLLKSNKRWYIPSFLGSNYSLLMNLNLQEKNNQELIYFLLKSDANDSIENKDNINFKSLLIPQDNEDGYVRNLKLIIAKKSKEIFQERCNSISLILRTNWEVPKEITKNILFPYLQEKDLTQKNENENSTCLIN